MPSSLGLDLTLDPAAPQSVAPPPPPPPPAPSAVRSAARPEPAQRPPRHATRTLGLGLGLGAFAALWLDGSAPGLGLLLSFLAFALALVAVSGREGWQAARAHRGLLAGAVVLASLVVVRDSPWLVALDLFAAAWLLGLAVQGWSGEDSVFEAGLGEVAAGPLAVAAHSAWQGGRAVGEHARLSSLATTGRAAAAPTARVALVAGPVLALVTVLLAHGDAVFAHRLGLAWDALGALPLGEVLRAALVTATVGPVAVGALRWALRRRQRLGPAPESAPRLTLGAAEAFALVGGLLGLFALFDAVSVECALSPEACTLPAGTTYSDWAREGFFELLAAAAVVLCVLVAVPERARLGASGRAALRATATALVAASLPLLFAAFRKLSLYEAAYGFTRLRVASQAACLLIAAWLGWRALTLFRWPRRFAVGAVALGAAGAAALTVFDLDGFVARRNVERSWTTGLLDVEYVAGLSLDAAPALVEFAQSSAPAHLRSVVTHEALRRFDRAPRDGWLGAHFARARGRSLVASALPALEVEFAGPQAADDCRAP